MLPEHRPVLSNLRHALCAPKMPYGRHMEIVTEVLPPARKDSRNVPGKNSKTNMVCHAEVTAEGTESTKGKDK